MNALVDDRYKIHVYLDTNILVDYVEQNNTLLNKSLEYLSNCPFVILRSSHYVEYEMAEVRKKRLFYFKVKGAYPLKKDKLTKIKHNWCIDGKKYEDYKDEITKLVIADFEMIESNLGTIFDDHVLHNKLIYPTRDLCLASKISREDSMVTISCVYPKPMPDEILDFCVLLSNDDQYVSSFNKNRTDIIPVFKQYGLKPPILYSTKHLNDGKRNLDIEKNSLKDDNDIHDFWTQLILRLIRLKHYHFYLGHTIKIGNSAKASELVFVDIEEPNKELIDSEGLIIVFGNLSGTIEIDKDFDYWDNYSSVILPHTNQKDTTYSFKPNILDVNVLKTIQAKGNLVFYSNN
jgi:hypothetical protein